MKKRCNFGCSEYCTQLASCSLAAEAYKLPKGQVNFSAFLAHNEISQTSYSVKVKRKKMNLLPTSAVQCNKPGVNQNF